MDRLHATATAGRGVGAGQRQGLLRFDLSAIPSGAVITSATATLQVSVSYTTNLTTITLPDGTTIPQDSSGITAPEQAALTGLGGDRAG